MTGVWNFTPSGSSIPITINHNSAGVDLLITGSTATALFAQVNSTSTSNGGAAGLSLKEGTGNSSALEMFNAATTPAPLTGGPTGEQLTLATNQNVPLVLGTNGLARMQISGAGAVTINAPTSGNALTANGEANTPVAAFNNTNANGYANISFTNDTSKSLSIGVGGSTAAGASQNQPFIGTITNDSFAFLTNGVNRGNISSAGNVTVNAPTSGYALTVNGGMSTAQGSVSAANSTATTIYAAPSVNQTAYLVTCQVSNSNDQANYGAVSLVTTGTSTAKATALQTATLMTITVSGLNIQCTQGSGSTNTVTWSVLRFGNL
jgi:hypothetical protein